MSSEPEPAQPDGNRPPRYEEARAELVDVVRRLEQGGSSLEDSLALWERGEELANVCQAWLDGAKAKLDAAIAERTGGTEEPPAQADQPTGAPGRPTPADD